MKPKKLIRSKITEKLKEGEWETITDQDELNRLYATKIREELAEIQASDHKDIMEFVDLIEVAFTFARENGFTDIEIIANRAKKITEKGKFGRLALNSLNPENPSNCLYFEPVTVDNLSVVELIALEKYFSAYANQGGCRTAKQNTARLANISIEQRLLRIGESVK
jgi:predicted house-cleaning noncanonical NTP pyrophosphatase (MazG superfamily)